MMYFIMALDALDYAQDHPDRVEAIRHFESLLIETEDRFIFQPCVSPIWDTAICAFAMGEAGVKDDPRLTRAADWLISKEVRRKGDWSIKRPDTEPSGWAFEFANEFYPDIDDTAMVLLALHARQRLESGCAGGLRAARHQLAARHAIGRRRVGGVRCGQQLGGAQSGALRGPQRDARSDVSRYHGARAGVPLPARHGGSRGGAPRRGVSARRAGEGWQLVRALGRELHLRIVSWRCAAWQPAERPGRRMRWTGRRSGCGPSRIRTAAGANPAPATPSDCFVPAPSSASQTAWALLGLQAAGDSRVGAVPCRASKYLLEQANAGGHNGPKGLPPAQDFPTFST